MADNKIVLEAFCIQLTDFMTDIQNIYPDDESVFKMKTAIGSLIKIDSKLLMIYWKHYVIGKYYAQISTGDINFFLEKNYTEDVVTCGIEGAKDSASKILAVIDELRNKIREMSPGNKTKTSEYMQNLAKLSNMYKG